MTKSTFGTAAYGGENWSQRIRTHRQEIGDLWPMGGQDSEWRRLKAVLLHCPGDELLISHNDPDAVQMLAAVDLDKARAEHQAMAAAFGAEGVEVLNANPIGPARPNQMFCADLFVMTPEGAIIARPASTVRAGEEVAVARALADAGVPILRILTGQATFEGADLMWLDEKTAMIGRGHRTNQAAIDQITTALAEIGCDTIAVDLPYGTMHFMGMLRITGPKTAICWPRRTPHATVLALQARGFDVLFPPFEDNQPSYRAMNFVTLDENRILMVADLPEFQGYYEDNGITCVTAPTAELSKAAGNIGCLTGIVAREMA